jgi:hypothetical protein
LLHNINNFYVWYIINCSYLFYLAIFHHKIINEKKIFINHGNFDRLICGRKHNLVKASEKLIDKSKEKEKIDENEEKKMLRKK